MKTISLTVTIVLILVMTAPALARPDDPPDPAGKAYPPPTLLRAKYLPESFTVPTATVQAVRGLEGLAPPDRNEPGDNGGYSGPLPWVATPIPVVPSPYPGP